MALARISGLERAISRRYTCSGGGDGNPAIPMTEWNEQGKPD
jgi:hypothetical protein